MSLNKRKWCWVATQFGKRDQWRLKLAIGPKDYPVRGAVLTMGEVRAVTAGQKCVYVHQIDGGMDGKGSSKVPARRR